MPCFFLYCVGMFTRAEWNAMTPSEKVEASLTALGAHSIKTLALYIRRSRGYILVRKRNEKDFSQSENELLYSVCGNTDSAGTATLIPMDADLKPFVRVGETTPISDYTRFMQGNAHAGMVAHYMSNAIKQAGLTDKEFAVSITSQYGTPSSATLLNVIVTHPVLKGITVSILPDVNSGVCKMKIVVSVASCNKVFRTSVCDTKHMNCVNRVAWFINKSISKHRNDGNRETKS